MRQKLSYQSWKQQPTRRNECQGQEKESETILIS